MRKVSLLALLISIVGWSSQRLHSMEFVVEGYTTYEVLHAGTRQFASTNLFKVVVSNCDWKITSAPHSPEERQYTEMANTADELRILYAFRGITNAQIEKNTVPPDDGSTISHIWLAYASACEIRKATNGMLKPIWPLDDRQLRFENYKVKAQWAFNPQDTLPRSVAFFHDGVYRAVLKGRRIVFPVPAPYSSGFTNAIHSVLEWTNHGDVILPTHFLFQRFGPTIGAKSSNELSTINIVHGYLRKLSVNTQIEAFAPSFDGRVHVTDQRFSPVLKDVTYWTSNGVWQETTNAGVTAERDRQMRVRGLSRAAPTATIRLALTLILFALIAAPLAGLLLAHHKKKRQEER